MKKSMFFVSLLATSLLEAQTPNLIVNSDFDKPLDAECRYDAAPGVFKRQIITEDRTWNRCFKIELLKYTQNANGKVFYLSIRIGGNKKEPGFPVKPNTLYSFSMELKGTAKCKICAWGWPSLNYWKNMKPLKITGDTVFKPNQDWTVVKGTFQTRPDMKYAAVGIEIWGAERYKNLPELGGYILLDKVKVTEKQELLGGGSAKTASSAFSVPLKKAVLPGRSASGFVRIKTAGKVSADTEFTVNPGATEITLNIRCHEPETAKVKSAVSEAGGNVWQDDNVEIFFGPVVKDRALSQFVVSAGGGRWMGRGSGVEVDRSDYERWSAKVAKGKDVWTVDVKIPYELLGWKKRPAPGTVIPFNLCRTRTTVPETSSYAFAGDSFHDVKNYAVLWLDQPEKWFEQMKAELCKQADSLPNKDLSVRINQWKLIDVAKDYRQAELFRREIEAAKLGKRTHAVTQISPATDPTIPMIPAELASLPEKVRIRAAGNEFKALPLAVTNLLDRPEEYRIVIAAVNGNAEESSLKRSDGTFFPAEKIRLYRGIRVKDDDSKNHGLRYDPLAPMDITSTVMVMPKEAAPVWAVFDTAGVPPGIYRGMVRVISLGEAVMKGKGGLKLPMVDLPLELEVLPFEISRAPAIPQFLFSLLYGERETFRMMREHDIDTFLIDPWRIAASFNEDGSIKSSNTAAAERDLMKLKKYAREFGIEKDLRIGIVYNIYTVFRRVHAKQKFKYGTPEWKKAWQEYVKLIDRFRQKCGIPAESCFAEIRDEPKEEQLDELIAAARTAHEAAPELNLMITIGADALSLKKLRELSQYVKYWCFWGSKYFTRPEYAGFTKELRAAGKNISFYSCDTTLRLDLQQYYITHAWRALAFGLDMCNLYEFMTYRHADDWKKKTSGSLALTAAGHPVSTIRLECLRIGSTDIKYMKKLSEVLKSSRSQDRQLRNEVEKFLKETPMRVGVTQAHDPGASAAAREKAIDFILKLMK